MKAINLVLLIRNEIEREGLKRLLSDQWTTVVGTYPDAASVDLDDYAESMTGLPVIIVDLGTNAENIEACRQLRVRWLQCRIVFFTAQCDSRTVIDALNAGADGVVAKQTPVSSLGKKLMLVALGEKSIPSDVFLEFLTQQATAPKPIEDSDVTDAKLSDRELQILERLISGDANKVISRHMEIAEATVKVHVKAILRKLSVANRTQAAIWGISHGIGTVLPPAALPLAA